MSGDERGMRQALIRHLVANLQCVSCGEQYVRNDIYVLGHHDDIWVSAVVCSRCGTQGLAFATLREEEHLEIASEAAADETAILEKTPVLSMDDVLDVHALLRDFRGDVHSLLRAGNHSDR